MRRLLTTIVFACCALCATAQASGDRVSIGDFQQIDAKGNIQLIISQSDSSPAFTVEYSNITERDFHFQVRKGVLYLDVPSGLLVAQGFARVTINVPKLERIKSEGATIECATPIKGEYFEYVTQGSVNMAMLNVEVNKLVVKTSGKSDVMVIGSAIETYLSAKIGSRIDAFRLITEVSNAECFDGSEIYVCPTKSLKAKASTAGSIYYMGEATIEPKVSLWGDVVLIERATYRPIFNATTNPTATSTAPKIETTKPTLIKEEKQAEKPTPKPTERKVEKKTTKKQSPPVEKSSSSSSDGDFF